MSVFQPRDPLKEAVAAWVASAEPAASAGKADAEAGADPGTGAGSGGAAGRGAGSGGDAGSGADETQAFEAVPDAKPSPGRVDPPAGPSKLAGLVRQSAPSDPEQESDAESKSDSASAGAAGPADAAAGGDKPGVTAFGVRGPGSASGPETASASGAGAASGATSGAASGAARDGADKPVRDPRSAEKPETTAFGVVKSGPAKDDARADESERTAVFRAPKLDSASGRGGAGSAAADKPEVTAFGVVKPASGATSGSGAAAASASGSASGADRDGAARPARDDRTTAFGVLRPPAKPDAVSGGESDTGSDGGAKADAEAADAPKPDARRDATPSTASAAADSERTAVFRAVRPDSAPPAVPVKPAPTADAAKKPTGGGAPATDAKDAATAEDARDSGGGAPDSERTAVFRAVKADSAPPAPGKTPPAAPDSERTAVFRAVKPGTAPPAAPGKPAPATDAAKKPTGGEAPATDPKGAVTGGAADAKGDERPTAGKGPTAGAGGTGGTKAPTDPTDPTDNKAPTDTKDPKGADGADRARGDRAGAGSDSERTAVFRAVKPGDARPAPAGDAPKTAAERASSTFVPLRGDLPAPPKPTPVAGPPAPPKPAPAYPAAPKPPAPAGPAAAPPAANRLDPSERTTQQPLPPRPPLDMLADLTNNPPPPPSPLRTAVRRFKIYAPIVLLLAVVLAVVQLVRPLPAPKLAMTAKSSYTFPGGKPDLPWPTEGQASMAAAGLGTIGSSGEQKPVPIASVTKSMTAYIILRDHPFKKGEKGAMIDVDKTAETEGQKDKSDNESTLNTVKEGDKISEYDAVAALMIPSANNIARLLARWDSGTQEAFVKKMNDTAKELGMTNTTYTDPSGLDATTVSTAEDQVKLGLKIVEIPALVDITSKPSWVDPSGKTWPNWNRLVPYNETLGIKTGTTTKAGGNLLFAAQKKVGGTNQLIVGAVLGQHKPPIIDSVIAASRTLLIATQKSLEGAPVVKKGDVVGYVDDGLGGRTPVVATADVQAVGWSSLTVDIKLGDGGTKIPATAKAGTEVGVLTVGEGASQVKVPVALKTELATPGIGSKLVRIG
ncbi:hypothetical protein [Streptomyces sp. NPDC057939]|uniref:hypothetical protein n=1 Tax=Streptomyces sp. NPDC057939 TaxID=3346284 RepID=UPI0036E61E7A